MPNSKDLRIAIIGAGPAGLSAAEALKELGYSNVVIFEKRDRPGGQAYSKKYKTNDGSEFIYELGSLQPISAWMGSFHKLIKKYQIEIGKSVAGKKKLKVKVYSFEKRKVEVDFTKTPIGYPLKKIFPIMMDALKLAYFLFKYRSLAKPGYSQLPEKYVDELSISCEAWIVQQNFRVVGKDLLFLVGSMVTFANPKLKSEVPAIKFFKLLQYLIKFPPRYINGTVKLFKSGYQNLWNQIGKKHHIIYNAHIAKIARSTNEVNIEYNNEVATFDKVIVTCPVNELLRILDCTDEEKTIFEPARFCPGWRGAFLAKNLPHDAAYSFYEPFFDENFPVRLHAFIPEAEVEPGVWLYQCIIAYSQRENINEVIEKIKMGLKEYFNGDVVEWLDQVYWYDYDPFFNAEQIKNGVYKKIDAIQGKNNTYFLGGLISGGTHAIIVNYNYDFIKKHFS